MPFAHSRITSEDETLLQSVVLWIRSNAKCILAVQEVSKENKKHIHVMSETNLSISRFGDKLRKQFPVLKGNGSHSTSEFKESYDHNLRYLCKGEIAGNKNSVRVLFTTLEQSVIDDAHERFWQEQNKWLTEHGVKPGDKKKKREPNFKEKVIAHLPVGVPEAFAALHCLYKPSDYEANEFEKVKIQIMDTCFECMGKYAKDCDDNIMSRLVNGIFVKIVTDYGNKESKRSLYDRLGKRISHNLLF